MSSTAEAEEQPDVQDNVDNSDDEVGLDSELSFDASSGSLFTPNPTRSKKATSIPWYELFVPLNQRLLNQAFRPRSLPPFELGAKTVNPVTPRRPPRQPSSGAHTLSSSYDGPLANDSDDELLLAQSPDVDIDALESNPLFSLSPQKLRSHSERLALRSVQVQHTHKPALPTAPLFRNPSLTPSPSTSSKVSSSPPSQPSALVETPTLRKFGMTYNVTYDFFICTECEAAFGSNNFVSHAYGGSIVKYGLNTETNLHFIIREGKQYLKHNMPPLLRQNARKTKVPPNEILGTVLKEIRQLGYTPSPPLVPANTQREEWIKIVIPHPDETAPIEGLRIHSQGIRCKNGHCLNADFPFCALSEGGMRAHAIKEHPDVLPQERVYDHGVPVQSFASTPQHLVFYFEVPGGVIPSPSQVQLAMQNLSLEDVLSLEQDELLGGVSVVEVDTALLHPGYVILGMKDYWSTFDITVIRHLLELTTQILPHDYKTRTLRSALLATFLEMCALTKKANPAI